LYSGPIFNSLTVNISHRKSQNQQLTSNFTYSGVKKWPLMAIDPNFVLT